MPKSSCLRARDVAALLNLVGECRDLGADPFAWRDHLIAGLSELVDAEGGFTGEMAGCRSMELADLGVTTWWRPGRRTLPELDPEIAAFIRDPKNWSALAHYHRENREAGGLCLARKDFLGDRDWHGSPDCAWGRHLWQTDHPLWCFHPLPGGAPDEHIGIILYRDHGRPDYAPRARTMVRLAFESLATLVGPRLARFGDPSPRDLTPRVRQVLACMLEGDGDKQIAARLGISEHTVNQHSKALFRHFRVHGRAELLAHWLRRGWPPEIPGAEPVGKSNREEL